MSWHDIFPSRFGIILSVHQVEESLLPDGLWVEVRPDQFTSDPFTWRRWFSEDDRYPFTVHRFARPNGWWNVLHIATDHAKTQPRASTWQLKQLCSDSIRCSVSRLQAVFKGGMRFAKDLSSVRWSVTQLEEAFCINYPFAFAGGDGHLWIFGWWKSSSEPLWEVQSDRADFAHPDQFIRSKSCSLPTSR